MFIVGLVLRIFAFKIARKEYKCQNALTGLIVIRVTLGINRDTGKSNKSVNGMIFVFVSVIHQDSRKDTPIFLTMSVLMISWIQYL